MSVHVQNANRIGRSIEERRDQAAHAADAEVAPLRHGARLRATFRRPVRDQQGRARRPETLEIANSPCPTGVAPRRLASLAMTCWYSDYSAAIRQARSATGKVPNGSRERPKSALWHLGDQRCIWYTNRVGAEHGGALDPRPRNQSWAIPARQHRAQYDVTTDGNFVLANSLVNEVTLVRIAK